MPSQRHNYNGENETLLTKKFDRQFCNIQSKGVYFKTSRLLSEWFRSDLKLDNVNSVVLKIFFYFFLISVNSTSNVSDHWIKDLRFNLYLYQKFISALVEW